MAVREDHDGFDVDFGKVTRAGASAFSISENSVGGDGWILGHDVVGHDDVFESVLLGDFAAAVAFTIHYQNGS